MRNVKNNKMPFEFAQQQHWIEMVVVVVKGLKFIPKLCHLMNEEYFNGLIFLFLFLVSPLRMAMAKSF